MCFLGVFLELFFLIMFVFVCGSNCCVDLVCFVSVVWCDKVGVFSGGVVLVVFIVG